jgi:hypothetical protein
MATTPPTPASRARSATTATAARATPAAWAASLPRTAPDPVRRRLICTRTKGIDVTDRPASTAQAPTARPTVPSPARTTAAATAPMPTAPDSSGTRRRPRLRMSNHSSTTTSGAASAIGHIHATPASHHAPAASAPRATASTMAMARAVRVRASQRCRKRSTRTTFNGVRSTKASTAPTPNRAPAAEGRANSPSATGSAVRPQPPCSDGTATVTQVGRGAAAAGGPPPADGVPAVATEPTPRGSGRPCDPMARGSRIATTPARAEGPGAAGSTGASSPTRPTTRPPGATTPRRDRGVVGDVDGAPGAPSTQR